MHVSRLTEGAKLRAFEVNVRFAVPGSGIMEWPVPTTNDVSPARTGLRVKPVIAIALSLLVAPGCASGVDPKDVGAQALNGGNAQEAYRLWLPLAKAGDAQVQEAVALILVSNSSLGPTRSRRDREREALGWVAVSAESGWPSSMTWLADAYRNGFLGLAKDPIAAVCWAKAAKDPSLAATCKRPGGPK